MKQAKVLTDAERERLLAVIANDKHSEDEIDSFIAAIRELARA